MSNIKLPETLAAAALKVAIDQVFVWQLPELRPKTLEEIPAVIHERLEMVRWLYAKLIESAPEWSGLYDEWVALNGSRSPSVKYAMGWMHGRMAAQVAAMQYACSHMDLVFADKDAEIERLRADRKALLDDWQAERERMQTERDQLVSTLEYLEDINVDQWHDISFERVINEALKPYRTRQVK